MRKKRIHTERAKTHQISTKKSKAKLPNYKAKAKIVLRVKSSVEKTEKSVSSTKRTGRIKNNALCSLQRKKKLLRRKGITKVSNVNDNLEDCSILNMGGNRFSTNIPSVLKDQPEMDLEIEVAESAMSFEHSTHQTDKDACIIVADSINPSEVSNNSKECIKTQQQNIELKSTENAPSHDSDSEGVYTNKSVNSQSTLEEIDRSQECDTKIITTYMPRFYNIRNNIIVIMKEQDRFCFAGKIIAKVLYGAIEVYGSVITPLNSPKQVYSPRGFSFVTIATSSKYPQCSVSDVWTTLTAEGINSNDETQLQKDINECRPGMVILVLTNLENSLTRFLNVYCLLKLFPKIKNVTNYSWMGPRRAEMILQSNLYPCDQSVKELVVDPNITGEITDKVLNQWRSFGWSCTLIAGGKDVGKSTAMRCLINSLLPASKKVVLLDIDPGQSECTPACCVSYSLIEEPLLGPNFTHLKHPVHQIYIGDTNVSNCIAQYIEAIKMLTGKLSSCPELSAFPIVVNTMGFTFGLGWDIIRFTIKLMRPSLVIQIMSRHTKHNYPDLLSCSVVDLQKSVWTLWKRDIMDWDKPCTHDLRVIHSQAEYNCDSSNDAWNMEPYQKRELVMLSYLSEITNDIDNSMSHGILLTPSINQVIPYMTSFTKLSISIPQPSLPSSHVLIAINGNIVALCGLDRINGFDLSTNSSSGPHVLARLPLCTCYGFGIVRGIDMERKEIFINTPVPASVMQCVNCLIGCIPVPQTLLQLDQIGAPYVGTVNTLPTSREPRRGYFRMRYTERQSSM